MNVFVPGEINPMVGLHKFSKIDWLKVPFVFLFFFVFNQTVYGASSAFAVREQSFNEVGTGTTVSVSTSAWTALPTASSLTGRQGIMVSNDSANTQPLALLISSQSSSPSEAITVETIYLSAGATIFLGVPAKLYLYGVYLGAAAGNVHVKEFSQ